MGSFVQKDFEWVRGTTPRIAFEFKTKKTMTDGSIEREAIIFDDAILTVYSGRKGGDLLFRYSIGSGEITLTDPTLGRIEMTMDANDTRSLRETLPGAEGKNRYEIELRNGRAERVYIMGFIAGVGGINSDEDVEVIVDGGN